MKIKNVFLTLLSILSLGCSMTQGIEPKVEPPEGVDPELLEEYETPKTPEEMDAARRRHEELSQALYKHREVIDDTQAQLQSVQEQFDPQHEQVQTLQQKLAKLKRQEAILHQAKDAHAENIQNYIEFPRRRKSTAKTPAEEKEAFHEKPPLAQRFSTEFKNIISQPTEATKDQIINFSEEFSQQAIKTNQELERAINEVDTLPPDLKDKTKTKIGARLNEINDLYTQVTEKLDNIKQEEAKGRTDLADIKTKLTDLKEKIDGQQARLESMLIEDLAKEKVTMWQKIKKAVKDFFKPRISKSTAEFRRQLEKQSKELTQLDDRTKEAAQSYYNNIKRNFEGQKGYQESVKRIIEGDKTPTEKIKELKTFEPFLDSAIETLERHQEQLKDPKEIQDIQTLITNVGHLLARYKGDYKTLFEKIRADFESIAKQGETPETDRVKQTLIKQYGEEAYEKFLEDYRNLINMGIKPKDPLGAKAREYLIHKGQTEPLAINQHEHKTLNELHGSLSTKLELNKIDTSTGYWQGALKSGYYIDAQLFYNLGQLKGQYQDLKNNINEHINTLQKQAST